MVPPGVWKTGRIELKSNVNLHLEEGAELHFSGNIKDYLPVALTRYEGIEVYSLGALVYACLLYTSDAAEHWYMLIIKKI